MTGRGVSWLGVGTPGARVVMPGAAVLVTPGAAVVLISGAAVVLMPGTAESVLPGATVVVTPGAAVVVTPGAAVVVTPGAAVVVTPGAAVVVISGAAVVLMPGTAESVLPGAAVVATPGAAVVATPGAAGTGLSVVVPRVAGVAAGVLLVAAGAARDVLGVIGTAEVVGTPVVPGTAVGTAVTAAGTGAGAGARQLRKVLGCRMTAAQRGADFRTWPALGTYSSRQQAITLGLLETTCKLAVTLRQLWEALQGASSGTHQSKRSPGAAG